MTIARAHLVDPSVTRWYHCVTRCVRRAFLLGEGMHDRKSWIEHRLEELVGEHTSIKQRVEHVKEQGRTDDLNAAQAGSVAGSTAAAGLEEGLWLCPVEDRRRLDSAREGMIEGYSLGNYVLLVEYTGRLFREGK